MNSGKTGKAGTVHVVLVGKGFAGLKCAMVLAARPEIAITLIDRTNYQQFQRCFIKWPQAFFRPTTRGSPRGTSCAIVRTWTCGWTKWLLWISRNDAAVEQAWIGDDALTLPVCKDGELAYVVDDLKTLKDLRT
jgi:hypothetical protein